MGVEENYNLNYKIELDKISKDLLLKNLSFKAWNNYQLYFGSILYIEKFTVQYVYNFCCNLVYCKVNCSTYNEKQELNRLKDNIKNFMEIISKEEYIKNYLVNSKTIGELYKREISKGNNYDIQNNIEANLNTKNK